MRFFEAKFETVLTRFYLMMAVIVIAFVIKMPLIAFLGLPIFLSAMLGIKFELPNGNIALTIKSNKKEKSGLLRTA